VADKRHNPTIIEEVFGAAAVAATIVSSPLLRPWYRKWGATVEERFCLERWPDAFPRYKRKVAKNLLFF